MLQEILKKLKFLPFYQGHFPIRCLTFHVYCKPLHSLEMALLTIPTDSVTLLCAFPESRLLIIYQSMDFGELIWCNVSDSIFLKVLKNSLEEIEFSAFLAVSFSSLCLTFHVYWKPLHSLEMTLLTIPIDSATFFCVFLDSSLLITYQSMNFGKSCCSNVFNSSFLKKFRQIPLQKLEFLHFQQCHALAVV